MTSQPPPRTFGAGYSTAQYSQTEARTVFDSPSIASMPRMGGTRRAQPSRTSRRRRNDENSDDDRGHNPGRLWACPFYKLDPWAHYRCMERYKFKRYADVKQHILRRHTLPGPNRLTNGEAATLRGVPPGLNDRKKWYHTWDNLFQGHQRPSSPYISHGIAEPIALLRTRAEPSLVAGLPPLLQSLHIEFDADVIAQLQTGIESMAFDASSPVPSSNPSLPSSPNGHFDHDTVRDDGDALILPSQLPSEHPPLSAGVMAPNHTSDAADLFPIVFPFDEYSLFHDEFSAHNHGWNGLDE